MLEINREESYVCVCVCVCMYDSSEYLQKGYSVYAAVNKIISVFAPKQIKG